MLTIRLFGHVRYEVDGVVAPFRAPPRAVAVLAYLIVNHATPVTRTFLAESMWPDDDVEIARGKLRRNLSVIVRSLPPAPKSSPYLITTMQTVRWNPAACATVDTLAFGVALREGRFEEANGWYGGDFLESFFDDWVIAERERLRSAQLDALSSAIRKRRGENDRTGALACVERMLEIDPWREDAVREQMTLRTELGDRSGAVAIFRAFVERLSAELDVDATPETRAVYDAIVRGERVRKTSDVSEAAAAAEPPAMPFTGRIDEYARLTRAWADAAYGNGAMVLIGGEAGAGKSRLTRELARHVEREGGGVLIGVTSPGETRPYEAIVDALRSAVPLLAATQSPEQLGVLARALPEIATRTHVVESPIRGPEAERERTFAAFFDALAILARRRPFLIVLEDLQWTSASSAALLEYLVRRVRKLPLLIVGTVRSEDTGRAHPLRALRRRLESEGALQHIGIGRLSRNDVASIVRAVTPDAAEPDTLVDRLFAFSEGVPFFLDAALNAGERPPANDRPGTLARMERLSDDARTLLGIAAVAGAGFSVDVLSEVTGWSESEILRALDALVESRFVREGQRRRFGDYAFSHHLVHAAVYERVPEPTRRRRHGLIARAMATLYDERSEAAAEIARHYEASGDAVAAARAHRFAALHARALFANDEALSHVERALALRPGDEDLVELHVLRAWLGQALGRSDSRTQSLAALATLRVEPAHLPEVERLRATGAMLEGRFDAARDAATRSLDAARALNDRRLMAFANLDSATIATVTDRYDDAENALDAAHTLAGDDEFLYLREMRARTLLAQRRGAHGAQLLAAAERLLAEAVRLGDPQAEAEAHVRIAHVDIAALDFAAAQSHFDRAAEAYRRFGNPRGVDSVQNNAANLALWSGDYVTAERLYAGCFAFADENGDEANMFGCTIGMALAAIYLGRLNLARQRMHAVAHLERRHGTLEDANFDLCSALIETECDADELARRAFDRALAIHRAKPATALFALTLAFAILQAVHADDASRAAALDEELGALSENLLCAEEFPHLMYWARASVALSRGDFDVARRYRSKADELYRERIAALTTTAGAFTAVPWNSRFLAAASDAFRTPRS